MQVFGPEKGLCFSHCKDSARGGSVHSLTSESVQSSALTFQGVDHVHGGNGLPLGVFGVGDCVSDNVLEEHLQYATSLLVDETGDTFHTTTAGQTTDRRLRDTLDVVTQHFSVPLGSSFSQSFASFTASGHIVDNTVAAVVERIRFCRFFPIYIHCRFQNIRTSIGRTLPTNRVVCTRSKVYIICRFRVRKIIVCC